MSYDTRAGLRFQPNTSQTDHQNYLTGTTQRGPSMKDVTAGSTVGKARDETS